MEPILWGFAVVSILLYTFISSVLVTVYFEVYSTFRRTKLRFPKTYRMIDKRLRKLSKFAKTEAMEFFEISKIIKFLEITHLLELSLLRFPKFQFSGSLNPIETLRLCY